MRLKTLVMITAALLCCGAVAQGQSVSNVQVTSLSATSATVTFTSGVAAFAGVSFQPVNGAWTTVNEAWAVNHSVVLSGLTAGTTYNYIPWVSGAAAVPAMSFTTPAASAAGLAVSNVQVTGLAATSATITFSSGVAAFAGVSYQGAGGAWVTQNEAWAVNHSVTLSGLTPGSTYTYIPWATGAAAVAPMTFQTPGAAATPAISNLQVSGITSTSATVTFSTGVAAFAGIIYTPAGGASVTINETTAVNHTVNLTGLTAGTQYTVSAWATGAASSSPVTFTTSTAASAASSGSVTNINVGSSVIRTGLKNVGMNIEGQDFYDSGQMLKNLAFRNPGFEGETWQSILHCTSVSANSCTDANVWSQWPANFLQGATYQFIYGAAAGQTGTVLSNAAASSTANTGMTINFSPMSTSPAAGDFVVVKMTVPGNAQAGWWSSTGGGGTLTTEYSDLSPNTIGMQALRMTASATGQSARVDSYFDSSNTRKFIVLNGTYKVTFRAKGTGGSNQLTVFAGRLIAGGTYLNQTITLTPSWQDYTLTFTANETAATSPGTVDLGFSVSGSSALLDDASLAEQGSASNTTAFRDEVVATLQSMHPGSLRYMDDGGPAFGSSIDNMITPAFGRQRSGSSEGSAEEDDVPLGLHEFLQLCQTVNAEPWYVLPPAISPAEIQNLIQYLGGSSTTTYGAKRAALGQSAPWTSVFPVIHLELGNEQWNNVTFPGNTINDPIAYGNRVTAVFGAARSSASYSASSFDLIMGSFVVNPWLTGQEAANATNYDSISVAPYMFGTFNDTSSTEAIFGSMFAEPEQWDTASSGWMAQQAQAAASAGKNLVVYEENLSTQSGSASQAFVNSTIPSVAGGITMANHMLLQIRDVGVKTQNIWALPGYNNVFTNTNGGSETSPVFGTVIDMGGDTNLQRPVFLAAQVVNSAILPNMLATTVTGANPTWNQPLSTNDSIQLTGAHMIQSFAFTDGSNSRSLAVVNLSRTSTLPVTFSGANAPSGNVSITTLTSANITDNNETSGVVAPTSTTVSSFQPASTYSLPPFSVTVLQWQQ